MTQNQQKILKAALAAIVITTLFPPFVVALHNGGVIGIGYGFIFLWPAPKFNDHLTGHIDVAMLIAEWIAIGIVSGILWSLWRDTKAPTLLGTLVMAINTRNDVSMETARIQADAIIHAAEIQSGKQ